MILYPIPYQKGILWVTEAINLIKGDIILCDDRNHISETPRYYIRTFSHYLNEWIMVAERLGQGENPEWTKKVVAQTGLFLSNIPYVEVEKNDGYQLQVKDKEGNIHTVWKYILSEDGEVSIWSNTWHGRHIIGKDCEWYHVVPAKKYTEENLRKAYEQGRIDHSPCYEDKDWVGIEGIIKSLQPKPVSVEIDMYNGNTGDFCEYWKDGKTFLKVKKVNCES